ncbi:hypothetical protein A9Q82_04875 [Cycloclasticus sp. 46_120_T64]|nr:hypothetical protein A9Q82_04875 [Cycloclasticus sp. 46_120_T64]
MSKQLLQMFTKAPQAGLVKTRLIADIGEQAACDVYLELLQKTLRLVADHAADTELYCAPDDQHEFFQRCIARYGLRLCSQQGAELGERMLCALQQGLTTHQKVVLVGADCPLLSEQYLDQAFAALDQVDVVLGPAEDGGFVLIACKKSHRKMFAEVRWGESSVLERTLLALDHAGLSHCLLDTLWDVDRIEDLHRWQAMR